jgi:hypothetical protein
MLCQNIIRHKRAVLSALISRVKTIYDPGSLAGEMDHLKKTFQKNGYSTMEIKCDLHPKQKHKTPETKTTSMAIIPYMQTISGKISRLPNRYNIKTIHWQVKKSNNLLRLARDNLG